MKLQKNDFIQNHENRNGFKEVHKSFAEWMVLQGIQLTMKIRTKSDVSTLSASSLDVGEVINTKAG